MIPRERYMNKIRPFFNKEIVKVLVGMRRCGKSVMLQLIQEELKQSGISREQFITINFESAKNKVLKDADALYAFLSEKAGQVNKKVYIMLDEIQEVNEWQTCINSLLVDLDVDIYITGSNAKLLSGELATYLAGRYIEIKIYPFSFQEVLMVEPQADERDLFMRYLQYGGMPFLYTAKLEQENAITYLTDIYNSVVLKDVVQRNSIRDTDLLDRIITYVISNIGAEFSAKSISDYMKSENRKIAPETVYNYLQACENAYLLHRVKRQNLIGKTILKTQEKFYLSDQGLREAVYGFNTRDIEKVLENIVYMELLRRGYIITVGNISGKEVDFVAERRESKLYVQVTYVMADEKTREREFSSLLSIPDNYPKYVVSLLDEANFSRDGIIHRNIREFLKAADY